ITALQTVRTSVNNTFDCEGGLIKGSDAAGVAGIQVNHTGWNVTNCKIQDFAVGIDVLEDSAGLAVSNVNVTSSAVGVRFTEASGSELTDLIINGSSSYAVHFAGSTSSINISSLDIVGGGVTTYGVYYSGGANTGTRIEGLSATVSGAGHHAIYLAGDAHDSNLIDCQGGVLDGDDASGAYGVLVSDADALTLRNCTVTDYQTGIRFTGTSTGSLVEDNNVSSSSVSGVNVSVSTVTASNFYRNAFCGSGGVLDAWDADTNAWLNNTCDESGGWAWCEYDCVGAGRVNDPPFVVSISLSPSTPLSSDDLNCSFVVADNNTYDTIRANISWFDGGVYAQSTDIAIINGTQYSSALSSASTQVGDNWTCRVAPYDMQDAGVASNVSSGTILQGCGTITADYTLPRSINSTGSCIVAGADDITVDCAGYAITGPDDAVSVGIDFNGRSNVTVQHCTIREFGTGVEADSGSVNGTVLNVSLLANNVQGVMVFGASHMDFDALTINLTATTSSADGVVIENSSNISLSDISIYEGVSSPGGLIVRSSQAINVSDLFVDIEEGSPVVLGGLVGGDAVSQVEVRGLSGYLRFGSASFVFVGIGSEGNLVDCQGGVLNGEGTSGGSEGFVFLDASDTRVQDCVAREFDYGLATASITEGLLTNLTVLNLTINGTIGYALELAGLQDSVLSGIRIANASGAQVIRFSDGAQGTNLSDLVVEDALGGVLFESGANTQNRIENISMALSGAVYAFDFEDEDQDANVVDCQGGVITGNDSSGGGGVRIVGADNVSVSRCTFVDMGSGVLASGTSTGHVFSGINVSSSALIGMNLSESSVTSSSIINSSFCGSAGAFDAYDYDSNDWSRVTCDDDGGATVCKFYCNGTLRNIEPVVSGVTLAPAEPLDSDELTCSFTISDEDATDALFALVTWWNGSSEGYEELVGVVNGSQASASLASTNTSAGEFWTCQVTPYDEYEYGDASNSSQAGITANVTACMTILSDAVLTTDISSPGATCFLVNASDVTVDCQDHRVYSDGTGLDRNAFLVLQDNVSIVNCVLEDFAGAQV
ncbi:MAG: hypothetical protein HC945_04435, partial [Nitrosarchaeum sp.]|nr:hypothetical protein [Nitrosarchaeum sp.]